eukprot:GHVL01010458.1.p1 GENE.GHVL01010458.1~~GHVL01010458.1.p1  ORF type:complete len:808 (+),score=143.16 GHVL01010458.1:67-2490(+)
MQFVPYNGGSIFERNQCVKPAGFQVKYVNAPQMEVVNYKIRDVNYQPLNFSQPNKNSFLLRNTNKIVCMPNGPEMRELTKKACESENCGICKGLVPPPGGVKGTVMRSLSSLYLEWSPPEYWDVTAHEPLVYVWYIKDSTQEPFEVGFFHFADSVTISGLQKNTSYSFYCCNFHGGRMSKSIAIENYILTREDQTVKVGHFDHNELYFNSRKTGIHYTLHAYLQQHFLSVSNTLPNYMDQYNAGYDVGPSRESRSPIPPEKNTDMNEFPYVGLDRLVDPAGHYWIKRSSEVYAGTDDPRAPDALPIVSNNETVVLDPSPYSQEEFFHEALNYQNYQQASNHQTIFPAFIPLPPPPQHHNIDISSRENSLNSYQSQLSLSSSQQSLGYFNLNNKYNSYNQLIKNEDKSDNETCITTDDSRSKTNSSENIFNINNTRKKIRLSNHYIDDIIINNKNNGAYIDHDPFRTPTTNDNKTNKKTSTDESNNLKAPISTQPSDNSSNPDIKTNKTRVIPKLNLKEFSPPRRDIQTTRNISEGRCDKEESNTEASMINRLILSSRDPSSTVRYPPSTVQYPPSTVRCPSSTARYINKLDEKTIANTHEEKMNNTPIEYKDTTPIRTMDKHMMSQRILSTDRINHYSQQNEKIMNTRDISPFPIGYLNKIQERYSSPLLRINEQNYGRNIAGVPNNQNMINNHNNIGYQIMPNNIGYQNMPNNYRKRCIDRASSQNNLLYPTVTCPMRHPTVTRPMRDPTVTGPMRHPTVTRPMRDPTVTLPMYPQAQYRYTDRSIPIFTGHFQQYPRYPQMLHRP